MPSKCLYYPLMAGRFFLSVLGSPFKGFSDYCQAMLSFNADGYDDEGRLDDEGQLEKSCRKSAR